MFQLFGVRCTLKDKCGQEKSSKAAAVCLYFALDSPFFCCDIDPDASVRELVVGNHAPEIEVTSRIRNTASETETGSPIDRRGSDRSRQNHPRSPPEPISAKVWGSRLAPSALQHFNTASLLPSSSRTAVGDLQRPEVIARAGD